MTKKDNEVFYIPSEYELFDAELANQDNPPEREGTFLFWGNYTGIEYVPHPALGSIPISLSLTVGIIKDKLTGRCCMAQVNKIRYK